MKILVLCTGNSCRSQMAEGYLRYFGGARVDVYSAGIETHGVNPRAIESMLDDGVDISQHTSNNMSEYLDINFDIILTVCDHAQERCPIFPSKARLLHQNFTDPAKAVGSEKEIADEFARVRAEIKAYCKDVVERYATF